MEAAYIPDVPERITRQQLIDATRLLGFEPYTVRSIQFDENTVHVTVGLYNTPEPALDDELAFYRGFGSKPGMTTTYSIPVSHPMPWGDGLRPA